MKTFTTKVCVLVFFLLRPSLATESTGDDNNDAIEPENDTIQQLIELVYQFSETFSQSYTTENATRFDVINETVAKFVNFYYWKTTDCRVHFNLKNKGKINSVWLRGKPLKIIAHGWKSSGDNMDGVNSIGKVYLEGQRYNVIIVDWSGLASRPLYVGAAFVTTEVGFVIAELLMYLVRSESVEPADIHFIGHSLGAHVAGACGFFFHPGKIGRISGLDPAAPLFENGVIDGLRNTSADFVDVIHTATDGWFLDLGFEDTLGHVDFYPNGGESQPGCETETCSHLRAYEYYKESITHPNSFLSRKCSSWEEYIAEKCDNNGIARMGHYTDYTARGKFYLYTHSSSPYSIT